jgi:hypothetical protein
MPHCHRFQPRYAALAVALSAAFPAFAAPAARIDFAIGNVVAVAADGARRSLARGAELASGDTVLTNDGRAQMRFTDGAMVSLKPGSEFRIDDYRFAGQPDGNERGVFSLLKGGLRTITGWIGRNDRSKYQVKTIVATIGVRGTEYSVTYGNSINVNTAEGIVEVCNAGGCLLLYPGDEGYVADEKSEPVLVQTGEERPKKDHTPPELTSIEAPANERSGEGAISVLPSQLAPISGPGTFGIAYGLTTAPIQLPGQGDSESSFLVSSGSFDAGGTLATIDVFPNFPAAGSTATTLGNDGIVGWGYWTAGASGLGWNQPTQAGDILHYAAGVPLSSDSIASLGVSLPSASYSLLGGSVSSNDNGVNLGTVDSGSMSVSFSTLQLNNLTLGITAGGSSYTMQYDSLFDVQQVTLSPSDLGFQVSGNDLFVFGCSGVCTGQNMTGSFFGTEASRAAVGFSFTDSGIQDIAGTAVFEQSTQQIIRGPSALDQ